MKYTTVPCDLDYNTNKQIIEDLIKEYPFLNVQLIGRTVLGRGIFSLSVGNNKNNAIYIGSVCGSDGLSGLILLLFIERLCRSIKSNHTLSSVNIRKALSFSGVTVIPCLNPDGRETDLYGPSGAKSMGSFVSSFYNTEKPRWNANAMGVDINRNFIFSAEAKETVHSPGPSFFRGEYPESEPETRTLTRLCRVKKFRQCLEIYSGESEIFYKSKENEPVSSQMMAKILSCSCSLPINADTNLRHAGIMDWFIKEHRRPAFAMGINGSVNEFYSTYAELEEALTVFSLL